jgi:hypothetical protein
MDDMNLYSVNYMFINEDDPEGPFGQLPPGMAPPGHNSVETVFVLAESLLEAVKHITEDRLKQGKEIAVMAAEMVVPSGKLEKAGIDLRAF